jgi:hypothetical protein
VEVSIEDICLGRLACSVWLNKAVDAAEACWMAMFSAYFDCSGAPGDGTALTVSGAVSSLDKWLKFETEWNAVLDKYGVPKPLHMSEFMFQWADRPDERDVILLALMKVIRKRTRKTFSTCVVLADWRRVNEDYELAESGWQPFPLCATQTLVKLEKWKDRNKIPEPIERIFEDGDRHREVFQKVMEEFDGSPSPIFEDKRLVPLQIGDFIAWQNTRTISRVLTQKLEYWEHVPATYLTLIRQENKDWGVFEADNLVEYCENHGVPRRQRLAS